MTTLPRRDSHLADDVLALLDDVPPAWADDVRRQLSLGYSVALAAHHDQIYRITDEGRWSMRETRATLRVMRELPSTLEPQEASLAAYKRIHCQCSFGECGVRGHDPDLPCTCDKIGAGIVVSAQCPRHNQPVPEW